MNKETLKRIELTKMARQAKDEYNAFKITSKKILETELKGIDKLIKEARYDYGINYRGIHKEIKDKTNNIKGIQTEIDKLTDILTGLKEELRETIENFEDIKKEKQRVHDNALRNVETKYKENTNKHFNNLSRAYVKQFQTERNNTERRKKNNAALSEKIKLLTRISKSKPKPKVRGTRSIRPALSPRPAISPGTTLSPRPAVSPRPALSPRPASRPVPRTRKTYNPLSRNLETY